MYITYKSRRILAGEISEFNGSPMLQLIVPCLGWNRMWFRNSCEIPRIILCNDIKTISFLNLPPNPIYSFVPFRAHRENIKIQLIRFNFFSRKNICFIVHNLEDGRRWEEKHFSLSFITSYTSVINAFSINTLFLQTYRESIHRTSNHGSIHLPPTIHSPKNRLVFLNRPVHPFRPRHFLSWEKYVRVSLAYANANLKPNTHRTVSRRRRWNTGSGGTATMANVLDFLLVES